MSDDGLPIRPKQHVSESMSIQLLERSLPKEWIVRGQRDNDYGIDCEIELVLPDGQVTGRFVKVQVKGRDTVAFNSEGHAYVDGIKHSTLRYWIALSKSAPVVAVLTSNSDGRVFFVPVFWQATMLLAGGASREGLRFFDKQELTAPHGDLYFLLMFFENPHEQIRAHKQMLMKLSSFLYEYLDLRQYDPWTINLDERLFREFLDCAEILHKPLDQKDRPYFNRRYWAAVSERDWNDSIMNAVGGDAYLKVLSLLMPKLARLRERVLEGQAYWREQDPEYLELVTSSLLPSDLDANALYEWLTDNKIRDGREY